MSLQVPVKNQNSSLKCQFHPLTIVIGQTGFKMNQFWEFREHYPHNFPNKQKQKEFRDQFSINRWHKQRAVKVGHKQWEVGTRPTYRLSIHLGVWRGRPGRCQWQRSWCSSLDCSLATLHPTARRCSKDTTVNWLNDLWPVTRSGIDHCPKSWLIAQIDDSSCSFIHTWQIMTDDR